MILEKMLMLMSRKKKKAVKKTDSAKEEPMKKTGFVAICTGKGLAEILTDLGVDRLIEGGQTMNPSTDDILKAINKVKAETIFVFPNNKNIIMAANQAKSICQKNVIVLPTKNIPQCISALMSYRADKEDDVNERNMLKAIEHVGTAQVTYAVRDTELDGKQIKKGDILGIAGSHIQVVGDSPERVCEELVDLLVKEDEDREFITVYCGKGIRKPKAEKLEKLLEETYEDFEVSVKRGGQPLYYYIISVE